MHYQSNGECNCLHASSGRRKTVASSQQTFKNASIWRRLWEINAGACYRRLKFPLISSGLMVLLQSLMLPNNNFFGKFASVQQIKDKILQSIKLFWTHSLHMRISTRILRRDVRTTAPPNQPTATCRWVLRSNLPQKESLWVHRFDRGLRV